MFKKLKWFVKDFEWMKVYFSPFKSPKPKFYFGKVAIGVPYFLPRVWKKATPEKARKKALEELERVKKHNSVEGNYKLREESFEVLYERYLRYEFAEPKKIGFDFVPMRWKTKWTDTDYRFESSPIWSFVFFKWQIAITFCAIEPYHFWESWLYYSRETKGTVEERLKQAKKEFPCVWKSSKNGVETTTCYWDLILKNRHLRK